MSDATDQDIRKQIGHRIKVRRVELELRQQDLADRLDLQQTHVSGWENGTRSIRAEQLVRLAKELDLTVGQLLGEQPRSL
jgi:transcriptional regulator with XRE-family HTH domain